MRRVALVLATMALAVLLAGGVAHAIIEPRIINGEPDTGPAAHPYVGAYVANIQGTPLLVCSGTLISPRVFLTAGHCTEPEVEMGRRAYVSFDPTYEPGASKLIRGTPYTHPDFCIENKCSPGPPGPIAGNPRYDVGVVVLQEPVRMATYGALPEAGLVDTLKEGQRLTVVGYGVTGFARGDGRLPQPVYPNDRYRATVRLLETKPAVGEMFVKTTGIGIRGKEGETTCYGDSGGPLFLPDQRTIVGVTSFGIAPLCRGPSYYQRTDLPQVLRWVRSFP